MSSKSETSPSIRVRPFAWKPHLSERRLLLLMGDLFLLSASLGLALWLRRSALELVSPTALRLWWWILLWVLWAFVSIPFECYDLRRAARPVPSGAAAAVVVTIVCLLYFIFPIIAAPLTRSRLAWFYFWSAATLSVSLWRVLYARVMRWSPLARRILIVGAGRSGRTLVEALQHLGSTSGAELVGWIDDDERLQGQQIQGIKVLGDSKALCAAVAEQGIDDLVVAITAPNTILGDLVKALVLCWERGIHVTPMALYYEELVGAVAIEHVGQNLFALVGPQGALFLRLWDILRRPADITFSIVGIILAAVFTPFLALAIYLDCPGPVFYCQERVGLAGKRFRIFKFRSMIPEAEKGCAQWAQAGDQRITRVGRFLRKTRFDELPQLWNLFKGNMTLSGPRPERPEFVNELCRLIPYYAIRHSVKPRLTGWAQVRYPYGNSYQDSIMKLQYDLYYLKHRGPILDLTILLRTINVVLGMKGL